MEILIKRTRPRGGVSEYPAETLRGFELVDDRVKSQKKKVESATFVRSLEKAADLIARGYSIRMIGPGKRASLISPQSLRITRT